MAGIMIEDQIAPKRCGHTKGKSVVGREEAYSRVRAACDARCSGGVVENECNEVTVAFELYWRRK